MLYTLRQARKALVESTNAYGQTDVREMVNRAIQNLAGMKGWERLRKVLRFPCIGPRFVLPQGCAGLVRACVNGHPATVRAQDFSFIHSGPGDAVNPPPGFAPVRPSNVLDAGQEPVMFVPAAPFRIGAWSPVGQTKGEANLDIRYIAPDGRVAHARVPVHEDPQFAADMTLVSGVRFSDETYDSDGETLPVWCPAPMQNVAEVVLDLPEGYGEYVTLYARYVSSDEAFPVALYNPEVDVPTFRHYMISGVGPNQPIEVLAEVRLEPLPLVQESDLLPFASLNPVEWVIRGDWMMKSGEPDAAQKYYAMAAQWLQSQEVVDTTVQTSFVVNSHFINSPGEISMEAVNI